MTIITTYDLRSLGLGQGQGLTSLGLVPYVLVNAIWYGI